MQLRSNFMYIPGLPECCPPPALPKLAPPFSIVANLLQCDAALHVLKCVLERAHDLRARSFSETQFHKVGTRPSYVKKIKFIKKKFLITL